MLDFCSGSSIYNYALGTVRHEKEIPVFAKENNSELIKWINDVKESAWGKLCFRFVETIIEESEPM